ncbi:hypothetical protein [Polymorphospora rubra]|uniref:Acyl-CoA dehydrogenase n=1 Tax=Polymorphospora rubra TaxID=338584 RepID=A0A810N8H9_9ACTN|nr:hypothetical protein [Polymorphospora rubra]BCJ69716.1 hypothetical protein Prubr_67370 [Polymorphospora rubra]
MTPTAVPTRPEDVPAALASGAIRRDRTAEPEPADLAALAVLTGSVDVDTPAGRAGSARQVRALARVDASAAQLVAAHHAARALAGPELAGGGHPATWYTHTAVPRHPAVRGTWRADGLLLSGTAPVPPGRGRDRLVVEAVTPADGRPVVAVVDAAAVRSGAAAFGQRWAAPATADLDGVLVPVDRTRPGAADRTWRAYDETLHAALDLGVLDGFLTAARDFLLHHARPWHESGTDTASRDPHAIAVFGHAYAQRQALDRLVAAAIHALDPAAGTPPTAAWPTADSTARPDTAAEPGPPRAAVLARWYAHHRIGQVVSAVIGVLGASGTAGRFALDRYWRDFRTHALRQPPYWTLADLDRPGDAGPAEGVDR